MSIQELENEVKRLPLDDRRKFMMDMFCECCEECLRDITFKDECVHTLENRGFDPRDVMSRFL